MQQTTDTGKNSDSCEIFAGMLTPLFNVNDALNITITFKPFYRSCDTIAAATDIDLVCRNVFKRYLICMENHKVDPTRKHYHVIGILPQAAFDLNTPYIHRNKLHWKRYKIDCYNYVKKWPEINRDLYNYFNTNFGRSTIYWNSEKVSDDSKYQNYVNYCLKESLPIYIETGDYETSKMLKSKFEQYNLNYK